MKVYKVAYETFAYDEYEGFVIVADNKQEALNMANNEGRSNRYKFSIKDVIEVSTEEKGIVLASFNAG